VKRRRFLQTLPLELLGAAALPSTLSAQHPGFAAAHADAPPQSAQCRYSVEDGAITLTNGDYLNNRPLYCAHRPAAALGGDRPLIRLIEEHEVAGVFCAGVIRGKAGKWLHEFDSVRMEYRCGHLLWRAGDRAWPGLQLTVEAVPFSHETGFAVRLAAAGSQPGDLLVWAFGGAHREKNAMWAFDPVLMAQDDGWRERLSTVLRRGFEAAKCAGNTVTMDGAMLCVSRPGGKRHGFARCSVGERLGIGDAASQPVVSKLIESSAGSSPLGFGVVSLYAQPAPLHWVAASGEVPSPALNSPARSFEAALAAAGDLGKRIVVKTPEPRLDAAVNAAIHAVDAIYYPPSFRHGCMAWNVRLPGWRTMYGGTVFGWHERVLAQGRFYIASQVKESTLTTGDPEPATRLCEQSSRSRLHGVGRVARDAGHYDFQSQMFDQLIHAWRWTGSPELEALLRGALELHTVWMRECFDPDGDGLYESYINSWPTDTVWYNGGGSVEESAYAYSAHRALADMAARQRDSAAEARHRQAAGHIKRALASVLWRAGQGHYAAYIEQGGHHRVHEDASMYSQFLPVDAGLCSFEEALQALHYCEWALENVQPKFGGRRVWTTNWVPSKWSARELYHGDNYHLALAYFQSGLGERGWEILQGNMLDSSFARVAPGSQSTAGAATDFGDILHPFCRSVVEGLFGYAPDLPNGVVHLRPSWPADWPESSIVTPDFSLEYRRLADTESYELKLEREAAVEFRIPVRAGQIRSVTCNGAPLKWSAEPASGCSMLQALAAKGTRFALRVEVAQRVPQAGWSDVTGEVGAAVRFPLAQGELIEVRDLHGVLQRVSEGPREARGRLANKPGHHLVLLKARVGELEQWAIFRVLVTDPEGESVSAARTPRTAPRTASWRHIDLAPVLNGDIRAIFKQEYVSPRPATVSLRLGIDGYSPWTFAPWKIAPPVIDLAQTAALTDAAGCIVTPQGAKFAAISGGRNIAFTSLWDNWPSHVVAPVNGAAEVAWLLIAGSTNPMQTRIANAVLKFRYADGIVETLELVPPLNFWSLCPLGGRDYLYERDGFCLPKQPPPTVQLGNNCRAMALSWRLRPRVPLESIALEALSQEAVIGLMGASLMNPA
jgi:hypothetical protein